MFTATYNIFMKSALKMWVNLRAKAGVQEENSYQHWIPAFAGMTET